MKFLVQDEFLVLMVLDPVYMNKPRPTYNIHELSKLRQAGIQTCHEQASWNLVEPAKGTYNFDLINNIVELNRQANLKSLIQICGMDYPKWMPNDWFLKCKDGKVDRNGLSLWNKDAQTHLDHYYHTLIDMYKDSPDVMFFWGEYQGGEGIIPPTWGLYDEFALKEFRDWYGSGATPDPNHHETITWLGSKILDHVVSKAKIFYDAYEEVWNAQQWLMNKWTPAFGNFVHVETLQKIKDTMPNANIVLLQYTYFDASHPQENVEYVDMIMNEVGCEVIVEAMFCAGLPTTTPKAITKGFRGQIICPTHPHTGKDVLEDWMVDSIRDSHNLWKDMRSE